MLAEIVAAKRKRLATVKQALSLGQLRERVKGGRLSSGTHTLSSALRSSSGLKIIAEFKRRSPSKGVIRTDADPVAISRAYERGGATAISVLTEEDYFAGSLADFRAVSETVTLPLLRKDFVVDEYQVWESAALGAGAVLLIVAALNDVELNSLRELAEDGLGLDALVEVHTAGELQRALDAGAKLIGINNRNLRTFEVSLETSLTLGAKAPADVLLVSESGLRNAQDLRTLWASGFRGFLIGETLMRTNDPEGALRALLSDAEPF